jgi:hypothetical protein
MTGLETLKKKYEREKAKLEKQQKKCDAASFAYIAAKYPKKEAAEIRVLVYAETLDW